jgi:hypothetical protein
VFLAVAVLLAIITVAAIAGVAPGPGFHNLPDSWRPLTAVSALALFAVAASHIVAGVGAARRNRRALRLGTVVSLLGTVPAVIAVLDEFSHAARLVDMAIYALVALLYGASAWSLLSARPWFNVAPSRPSASA